ncbi:MAG: hypothetical protein ACLFOA_08220 [Desulfohalobiaceae bacterium]
MPEAPIDFNAELRRLNLHSSVTSISSWILHPGMLFDSPWKWWGDLGKRNFAHEGLDLCCFKTSLDKDVHLVSPEMFFPAILSGTIALIIDDLLAQTIFIRHEAHRSASGCLFSIFAHASALNHLAQGSRINQGDALCTVPCLEKDIPGMQAHLHLSLAWVPKQMPVQELSWNLLNHRQGLILQDPLRWMHCQYQIDHNPFPLHTG